jgi:transposase-like protein
MIHNESKSSNLYELNEKHVRAIEALLQEPTVSSAAKKAGVGQATLFRWLNDPQFARAYKEARGRMLEGTLTSLQSASVDAVKCLREVINDTTAQASARVSAAKSVLDLSLKAREIFELEDRIEYLEKYLEVKAG